MTAAPQPRMLTCVTCADPFPYAGMGKPGKFCSVRCGSKRPPQGPALRLVEPAPAPARPEQAAPESRAPRSVFDLGKAPPRPSATPVVSGPSERVRVSNEPRRGDLIRSGDEHRLVVDRLQLDGVDCVLFKVLMQAEEHTYTLEEWRGWCRDRNALRQTAIEVIVDGRIKPRKGRSK